MGEKYLGQLTAKSAPAAGDILVLEDSEDTKKIDYDALANAILNKLTTKTYTVGGGTQTLISAIDALNSKITSIPTAKYYVSSNNQSCDTLPVGYALGTGKAGLNYPQDSKLWHVHTFAYEVNTDGTLKNGYQEAIEYNSDSYNKYYRKLYGGSWSSWVQISS